MLTLCAGIIYTKLYGFGAGMCIGGLFGNLGQLSGSVAAFFLGRYLFHGLLIEYFKNSKLLEAINRAVQRKGRKISFLLRFSLLFPYSVANYGLSITDLSPAIFVWGFLGCIPWEFVAAYFGYSVGNLADVLSGNYSMSE